MQEVSQELYCHFKFFTLSKRLAPFIPLRLARNWPTPADSSLQPFYHTSSAVRLFPLTGARHSSGPRLCQMNTSLVKACGFFPCSSAALQCGPFSQRGATNPALFSCHFIPSRNAASRFFFLWWAELSPAYGATLSSFPAVGLLNTVLTHFRRPFSVICATSYVRNLWKL